MALVDLKTDLKSLKFGSPPAYDRPGEGLSGQPYIKEPLIDGDIIPQSEDFLLRGGLNAPLDAATDVVRLSGYFADLKSPRGVLFTAKENVLSRIGVRTQASGVGLNEGIYTPLSTLTQASQGYLGGHVNKQGLNPFVGVTTYTDVKNVVIGESNGDGNRLVDLTNESINQTNLSNVLYSYSGGPNAPLGIGQTNIFKASLEQRTGLNNPKIKNSGFFPVSTPPSLPEELLNLDPGIFGSVNFNFTPETSETGKIAKSDFALRGFDVFKGGSYTTINAKEKTNTSISDFRQEIYKIKDQNVSYVTSIAPSYNPTNKKTIDNSAGTSRINYASPGQKGNIISYTKGKIVQGKVLTVDRINAQTIYQSKNAKNEEGFATNDLVKFRIAAINNDDPNTKQYIHFRAYIDSFSDAYSGNWNEERYLGRGESFWKYGGFSRTISLAFTVAAQSKPELIAQYKKLNFLASNLAPTYSSEGYMGGPLVQLTMGGWCYELPGFISSMTLDVPQESPWEIGINDEGKIDPTVKQLPHIVRVSGFSFTPIHKFRPQKQKLTFDDIGNLISRGKGATSEYGPQRYIALEDDPIEGETSNNYDS